MKGGLAASSALFLSCPTRCSLSWYAPRILPRMIYGYQRLIGWAFLECLVSPTAWQGRGSCLSPSPSWWGRIHCHLPDEAGVDAPLVVATETRSPERTGYVHTRWVVRPSAGNRAMQGGLQRAAFAKMRAGGRETQGVTAELFPPLGPEGQGEGAVIWYFDIIILIHFWDFIWIFLRDFLKYYQNFSMSPVILRTHFIAEIYYICKPCEMRNEVMLRDGLLWNSKMGYW